MLLMACALSSCDSGEYKNLDGTMVYSYWTASFGTINDTLRGADAATFKVVEDWLGHDNTHVYFKSRMVEGADPATLKPDKYPLFGDKHDYYYKGAPLHVSDMASFKVIKRFEDDLWASDSHYIYFDSVMVKEADVKTFKVKDDAFAIDKDHVFIGMQVVEDADPETYEILDWCYAKDKDHVWYINDIIKGADAATFSVDDDWQAHDKTGRYERGERVSSPQ